MTMGEFDQLMTHMEMVLSNTAFFSGPKTKLLRKIRRLLLRGVKSLQEVNILRGVLTSLEYALGTSDKQPQEHKGKRKKQQKTTALHLRDKMYPVKTTCSSLDRRQIAYGNYPEQQHSGSQTISNREVTAKGCGLASRRPDARDSLMLSTLLTRSALKIRFSPAGE